MDKKLFLFEIAYDYAHPERKYQYCILKANTKEEAINEAQYLRAEPSIISADYCMCGKIDHINFITELDLNKSDKIFFSTDSAIVFDYYEQERLHEILVSINEIINNLLTQSEEHVSEKDKNKLRKMFGDASFGNLSTMSKYVLINALSSKSGDIIDRYHALQFPVRDRSKSKDNQDQ